MSVECLDINSMKQQIDILVEELDLEILRFHRTPLKPASQKVYRNFDVFCFNEEDPSSASVHTKDTSDDTCYSDCTSIVDENVLSPSQVVESGIFPKSTGQVTIEVQQSLFGKTVGEMSPNCEPPVLLLCCRLGAYKWYVAKSTSQLRLLDRRVKEWLLSDGQDEPLNLPRFPDLSSVSSLEKCLSNCEAVQYYFRLLNTWINGRSNQQLMVLVGSFLQQDVIVPSPIFNTSAFVHVKQVIGTKVRFAVFTNSHLNIYDGPGGKLCKKLQLYLSSVQRVPGSPTTLAVAEFDRESVNIKHQTQISFESVQQCEKWMAMLQGATYTQGSSSQTLAALPFTLASWT